MINKQFNTYQPKWPTPREQVSLGNWKNDNYMLMWCEESEELEENYYTWVILHAQIYIQANTYKELEKQFHD